MGEEKKPLVRSERPWLRGRLRTVNGRGELHGLEGCGRRGCKRVAGNGWGEEAAGDERPWLRRGLTENGCGELRGRRECNGVAGNGWGEEAAGDQRAWLRGRHMGAQNFADGCGWRECNGVAGSGWGEEAAGDERAWLRGRRRTGKLVRRTARTAADGVVQQSGWKWMENRSCW